MAYVKIDMDAFSSYIKYMNDMVSRLVDANVNFARKIEDAGSEWYDDIYKEAYNQIFEMQKDTNIFIEGLEELDTDLVKWYCNLYENYADKTDYVRPHVDMSRVEIKTNQQKKGDEVYRVSTNALRVYIDSTENYTSSIRSELEAFKNKNVALAEDFHSRRYTEITARLNPAMRNIDDVLNEMDALAKYIEKKLPEIQSHE